MIIEDDSSSDNDNLIDNKAYQKKQSQIKTSGIGPSNKTLISFGRETESLNNQHKEQYQPNKVEVELKEGNKSKMKPKLPNQKSIAQSRIQTETHIEIDDGIAIENINDKVLSTFQINNDIDFFLSSYRFKAMLDTVINNIKPIQIEYAIFIESSTELARPGTSWTILNSSDENIINLEGIYSFIRKIKASSPMIYIIPLSIDNNSIVHIPFDLIKEKKFDEFASAIVHCIKPHHPLNVIASLSSLYSKLLLINSNNNGNINRFIRIIFFMNKFDRSIDIDDLIDTLSLFNDDIDNVNNLKACCVHFILFDYCYPLNEITFSSINDSKIRLNDYNPISNWNDNSSNELKHILNISSSIENNIIKLSNRSIENIKSLLTNDSLSDFIRAIDSLMEELYSLYAIIQEAKMKLKQTSMTHQEKTALLSSIEKEISNRAAIDRIVDQQIGNGLPFAFDNEAKSVLEQINANYNTINALISNLIQSNQNYYWIKIQKSIKDNYDNALNGINAIGMSLSLIEYITSIIKKEASSVIIKNKD